MRGRRLNMPAIGRAAGLALVAAAIVGAAVSFGRGAGGSAAASRVIPTADPLAAALAHCQAMGAAAQGAGPCEAVWAENRRRFFAGSASTGAAGAASAQAISAKSR